MTDTINERNKWTATAYTSTGSPVNLLPDAPLGEPRALAYQAAALGWVQATTSTMFYARWPTTPS